jgi:nicotinamidase-related amidase
MSTPANFNGARPVIDVNDAVMLLIDHQSGLFQTVGDMPMPELRARAAALAKIATLAKIPVITTASVPQGRTARLSRRSTPTRRMHSMLPVKARSTPGITRNSWRR